MTFLEAKKIVGSDIEANTYVPVARRAGLIYQDNKYRALVEKSIQLEPNDWTKFPEHLKNLHSDEFQQAQTQRQEVTNKGKSSEVVQGKTLIESTTQTQITPPKSGKSPTKRLLRKSTTRPPKTVKIAYKPSQKGKQTCWVRLWE